VGLRDEAVQYGIGDGGLGDVLVPFGDRKLRYDDGSGAFVAVFEELEEQQFRFTAASRSRGG
jgi:hypothetical protein